MSEDLKKSMDQALANLEAQAYDGFDSDSDDDDEDMSKGFFIDLFKAEDELNTDSGDADYDAFVKGLVELADRNTGRTARALEGMGNLVKSMHGVIGSLVDEVSELRNLVDTVASAPGAPKAVRNTAEADRLAKSIQGGEKINPSALDQEMGLVPSQEREIPAHFGAVKKAISTDLRKQWNQAEGLEKDSLAKSMRAVDAVPYDFSLGVAMQTMDERVQGMIKDLVLSEDK